MPIIFQEKRTFPRIELHTPIHYQIRGRPEFNNTVSDDISLTGIGFFNHKFLASGISLMLEINILSRVLRPIGRVVWASPLPHSNKYRLGIEFLELDSQEKSYLQDFIDMQTGKL